jgi:Zn-dependent protease
MRYSLRFSEIEKSHLLRAWTLVSLIFAVSLSGGISGVLKPANFAITFIIALVTVGLGFMLHELMHKLVAQRYGFFAEFRADDRMLLMAVLFSFLGFVFIAPGAVYIASHMITKEKNGRISVAGPLANAAVALLFLGISFTIPINIIALAARYGFQINSWLALFNMLPIPGFDGVKVYQWNKLAFLGALALAGALVLSATFIF